MYNYYTKRHKVFISYYHHDDQYYKNYIDKYLSSRIINKSVVAGEYDSDNSDEYIKRLIREDKISDSSVVVVLVGPNTRKRKHIDWEIYAGLSASVNGSSALIGIMLPTLKQAENGGYYYSALPDRLSDNIRSGYAQWYTWDYAIKNFDSIIEDAFKNRIQNKGKIDNSRLQMKRNEGE